MRIGPLSVPWLGGKEPDDPYWDLYVNRPPADPNNMVTQAFHQPRAGGVSPTRSEVHSPNVMASHIKEFGRFVGADQVGIVELAADPFPEEQSVLEVVSPGHDAPQRFFAVVSALKADYDPRTAQGIGGQTPALKGLFATFNMSAYIRELGYRATRDTISADRDRLAALAGLGTLAPDGRLVNRRLGPYVYVAEIIYTELPLEADGREARA